MPQGKCSVWGESLALMPGIPVYEVVGDFLDLVCVKDLSQVPVLASHIFRPILILRKQKEHLAEN